MLQRLLNRLRRMDDDQGGFTLIELLVVILIIGILAAIALPTFLGQSKKGQDASAKSQIRNAVTQVEACLAEATVATAAACGTSSNAGLAALGIGTTPGKVSVTGAATVAADGALSYTITARSKSTNSFTIQRTTTGAVVYSASPVDAKWADNSTS